MPGVVRRWVSAGFMAPALVVVVLLVLGPAAYVTWLGFYDVPLAAIARGVEGPATLANYRALLASPAFAQTVAVTFLYVFASTGIAFLMGLGAALALDGAFRGAALLRTLVLSPWAVAPVVASLVWMFLLDRQFGLVNYLALSTGLADQPVDWLTRSGPALASIVIVSVWKSFPFFAIMLLSGLQSIPPALYEAARLDGAGAISRFWDVTWPALRPTAAIAALFSLLTSFREVETILVLTGGGPARSTETVAVKVYVEAFEYYDLGESAALGTLALAAVALTASLLVLANRWRRT